ncbi:MAG: HdeD family acid-resistance protein [Acidimicrobiia bacterium]
MLAIASRYWWVLLLRGILAVGFGVMAILWPNITVLALVLVFGVYSLLDGALDLAMGIGGRGLPRSNRWSLVLMGLLGIAAGIVAFVWPQITAVALLWVVAFWAILTGILEIMAAIRLRAEIDNEWLWVLTGLLSIALGVLLILQPTTGALALVLYIGFFALAWGVALVALSFRLRGRTPGPTPSAA